MQGRSREAYDAAVTSALEAAGVQAVLLLRYARVWRRVLFDAGVVKTKEPFQRLFNQGMLTAFAYRVNAARQHRLLENSAAPILQNDTEEDEDDHSSAARRLQEFSDSEEATGEPVRLPIVTNPRYYSAREEAGLPELGSVRTASTIVLDEEPEYEPVAGPSGVSVQWPARALPRLPLSYYRDSQETEVDQSINQTVEILPTPAPRRLAPLGLLVRMLDNFCVE